MWLVRIGLIKKVRPMAMCPGVHKNRKASQCDFSSSSSSSKESCVRGSQRENREADPASPWRPAQETLA